MLINLIFARFHHIYTHRFESAYGDETTLNQAKREWALSLAGISAQRIESALDRCKIEHAWPPTIAEFYVLLQPNPEAYGLPSLDQAYLESCRVAHSPINHKWSHPCVQLTAQQVGYFVLRSEPEKTTRPKFKKVYLDIIERLIMGETFEIKAPKELPEPDFTEEQKLVEQLKRLGVDDMHAQQVAYYAEKPKQTDVRRRYRQQAQATLDSLGVDWQLPD